ncbi:MAG: RNA-binding S4 domain-containing protein [Rhodospirillales bacterium]|jgi:ribosome-associated heat shock protein Hsp15|nr:RNA-binding S4 domain-containing protein [Rhodospirillales bacterium]MBT3905498.1 RNA-binding S4 domain-containing protein [Rhodospirillaceae bacterium]MBT5036551.1 RNA-binding S4 domain-containing protein [Rhodospirillaceae bacterium]MBT6220042.1 RNA-binding S4 domain-containing protein [Rhodospirillaceae bacterium]MBT6362581.1 RNA-binding S4 domain-containing protein [Rhodospirillaceae bacterium]
MTKTQETDGAQDAALRIDKWLWYARFFKSRSLAAKVCAAKPVRVNSVLITKAHAVIRPGDVLTFSKGDHIRVIKVLALGTRRGPAKEAQSLYEDLSPPQPRASKKTGLTSPASRLPGSGRPTKAERRATDRLRQIDP